MPFGDKETHPTYGKIKVSRFTGDSRFFGSDVTHSGGVSIEISTATYERSLSHDWIHEDNSIVRVNISPLQFAELITVAMNTEGVPCTIYARDGRYVGALPENDNTEKFRKEYAEDVQSLKDNTDIAIDMIENILSGKTVRKSDVRDVLGRLKKVKQDVESNMPYLKRCFKDFMRKSTLEAKTSIEHFVNTKVISLGIEKMREQFGQIGFKEEEVSGTDE